MKTSLETERVENAADSGGGNKRISFSVDSLLGSRPESNSQEHTSNDADSTQHSESDESDVDIEDVESNAGESEPIEDGDELESRTGVVVPQPLLPRLYQGPAAPPTWPFGAFPWMAPNPMFRGGSPNSKYLYVFMSIIVR